MDEGLLLRQDVGGGAWAVGPGAGHVDVHRAARQNLLWRGVLVPRLQIPQGPLLPQSEATWSACVRVRVTWYQ